MQENRFEKLIVWQRAHGLVIKIYKITKNFPREEKFRLTDQLCRSASSVPANIVEGNARRHKKEYLQFLNTALSSLEETKYHLLLAKDLEYLSSLEYDELLSLANEVGRLISGLTRSLKSAKMSRV